MARLSKTVGVVLFAIGLALMAGFAAFVLRDERFQKAAMYKERNPGNVMYEGQYFAAFTVHVFLIGGAVCGGLVALNGATLWLAGSAVARLERLNLTAQRRER